jgi:outer membrane protein OmpA-like peptidoglycan-associated protein
MKHTLIGIFLFVCFYSPAQDSISLFFAFDSHKLSRKSQAELQSLLGKNIVSIYGYTDARGDHAYNKQLATNRINAALEFLGLAASSTAQVFAIGEDRLTSTLHAENRKVVIYFTQNPHEVQVNIPKKVVEVKSENGVGDQLVKAKVGDKVKLKALNFRPGLDVLLPEAIPTLEELLKVMKSNKNLIIEIHGHICCASADYADLSTARAYRVYEYLITNGIQSERISYQGFGVSQPLYAIPEKTSEEEIANRRVEVKIISN